MTPFEIDSARACRLPSILTHGRSTAGRPAAARRCRHARLNSTAKRTSGSSCARTGHRTASSSPSTISSIIAMKRSSKEPTPKRYRDGFAVSMSSGRRRSRSSSGRACRRRCEDAVAPQSGTRAQAARRPYYIGLRHSSDRSSRWPRPEGLPPSDENGSGRDGIDLVWPECDASDIIGSASTLIAIWSAPRGPGIKNRSGISRQSRVSERCRKPRWLSSQRKMGFNLRLCSLLRLTGLSGREPASLRAPRRRIRVAWRGR
jgi:hypothetical protein